MQSVYFGPGGGYTATIGRGAVSELRGAARAASSGTRSAIVTDSGVPRSVIEKVRVELCSAGFSVGVVTIPAGERSKTADTVMRICSELFSTGIKRGDLIVGVGGGLVGDTAGFAAAIYLRGVAFISVPTTVISQTDSAYGGKTGVDLPEGKNLLGVFCHPKAVICDTSFLDALGESEIASGMGEIIKYGAIADPAILEELRPGAPSDELVARCVGIKRRFVEKDEFDLGERRILNFGHTLGHAFETASGYTLPHGQAVALGMLAITRFGERIGVTDSGVYGKIAEACERVGLDTRWEERLPAALGFVAADKKSDGESVSAVLLERLGVPVIRSVGTDEFGKVL